MKVAGLKYTVGRSDVTMFSLKSWSKKYAKAASHGETAHGSTHPLVKVGAQWLIEVAAVLGLDTSLIFIGSTSKRTASSRACGPAGKPKHHPLQMTWLWNMVFLLAFMHLGMTVVWNPPNLAVLEKFRIALQDFLKKENVPGQQAPAQVLIYILYCNLFVEVFRGVRDHLRLALLESGRNRMFQQRKIAS